MSVLSSITVINLLIAKLAKNLFTRKVYLTPILFFQSTLSILHYIMANYDVQVFDEVVKAIRVVSEMYR